MADRGPQDTQPAEPGWWQASDGKWYPPESAPAPQQPTTATAYPYAPPVLPEPAKGNGLAITAMVLGIVGIVFCWVPFFGVLLGILAVIFGIIGARRASARGTKRGQARAGWILGSVTIVLGVVLTIVLINAANHISKSRVELAIKDYYTNNLNQPPQAVSCPKDLDKKVGASETCTVTKADGTTQTVTFTVTSIDGNTFIDHITPG